MTTKGHRGSIVRSSPFVVGSPPSFWQHQRIETSSAFLTALKTPSAPSTRAKATATPSSSPLFFARRSFASTATAHRRHWPLSLSLFPRTAAATAGGSISRARTRTSSSTALEAKKKGGGSGGGPSSSPSKKIQVKLTKQVAGTGQKGDIVSVTPAFYQNKLRPSQSATPISDEEVQKERQAREESDREAFEKAYALKETIEGELVELQIEKKAGPDGQLFGGVGPKTIVEELKGALVTVAAGADGEEILSQKGAKITDLVMMVQSDASEDGGDGEGRGEWKPKKMRGDIKHTGRYRATISLAKDVSAEFDIAVLAASE